MTDGTRPSQEFLSEAQEVVEAFSHNLLELDAQQKAGDFDPDILNAAFRAVHSLKGLAALFGAEDITALSHALEGTLDALRLGRLRLNPAALDVLFECVEAFGRMLASFGEGEPSTVDLPPLLGRIAALSGPSPAAADAAAANDLGGLDESILGVLTEYEEHRLRENVRLGRVLYRVHASFDLLAIDVGIEALKAKIKEFGEVITYLPSADGSADDRIDLDILVGSDRPLFELVAGVAEDGVTVHELGAGRKRPRSPTAPSIPPPSVVVETPGVTVMREDDEEVDDVRGEGSDLSLRSLSQTVRVDLERLDHLMNLIGELSVVHSNLGGEVDRLRAQGGAADRARELSMQLRTMARKLALLQQGLLEVRMVPLGQVFDKLARVVRKLGRDAAKDIRLSIAGANTELDKLIVEELSDPLMHMVRNCIDHGVERQVDRVAKGKPPAGRIDLRAFQRGNRVVIEVEDDGQGMDWRYIREVALRRNVVGPAEAREMTPAEVLDSVFRPGFTTREQATELSGRGVGMDVVKTNISKLSGMIDVDTAPGRGTKFTITLPVTLAIIQALVVQSAGQTFCIPLNAVLESITVRAADIGTVEGHEVISLRGRTLPLLHLSHIFDLPGHDTRQRERIYVVVVGLAQHRVGLVVDDLAGQKDVVIKPLGRALRGVPGIAGATELDANRTVLLLDVAGLVDDALMRSENRTGVPETELHGA